MNTLRSLRPIVLLPALASMAAGAEERSPEVLRLSWSNNILTIRGRHLQGGEVKVWYLEAYCRPGSTDRDWNRTVIPHRATVVKRRPMEDYLEIRDTLVDGVIVDHVIQSGVDEVDFQVTATNPTRTESQAHWAQPCVRVDTFTGVPAERASEAYLPQCFVFLDGRPARLPTQPWATQARYTPGQVWCPRNVDRNDVNPRPLSSLVPSNGLIGCYSKDGSQILATAWEPYQELFQGVIVCLHSDFRIGGLKPGETKRIRGKIYVVKADMPALLRRYERDFPEQVGPGAKQ
jgi:hypothetical protein